MQNKLAVIGIDSLDPQVIIKYRDQLKTFSSLIKDSPTFISQSIFPVDTIPAWATIYTGLNPDNHGLLYVYDIFDPNLSDLSKVNFQVLKGKIFWDFISAHGYKVDIIYPLMIYPAWEVNGVMICNSPFEKRKNWIQTEVDIDCYPSEIIEKYQIAKKFEKLWGGFPGYKQLDLWAELGKKFLSTEIDLSNKISTDEAWDLFFVYFSELDIIQHRLWRFFDENDPLFKKSNLGPHILDYYKIIDNYIGNFIETFPDVDLIVLSDHGHKIRPYKTFNVNEYLRVRNFLYSKGLQYQIQIVIKNLLLDVITYFDLEEKAIKLIISRPGISKSSKTAYSSAFAFDKNESVAYLSNFAGIKSYSFGGIEINRAMIPETDYDSICDSIIASLKTLKTPDNRDLFQWIVKRKNFAPGKFSEQIYPDIVFELQEDYATGWDMYTGYFGRSYDHKVASGGHSKTGVFLLKSDKNNRIKKELIQLADITPTILDLFEIEVTQIQFNGRSIFV